MSRHASSRGFTLIEVMVVVAILAIVAALVAPFVGRGTQSLKLRSEAGRVAALLRQARQHAVTQRRRTHVTFDGSRRVVRLTADDGDDALRELRMRSDIRLSVVVGGTVVTFSPRGLTRETQWVLEGPGRRQLAIGVEAVSGRVTVRSGAPS